MPRAKKVEETTEQKPAASKTVVERPAPKPKKKRKKNYLNNADLLEEVIKSKADGEMTPKLAKMLMMLCDRYATKPNYVNYTYNEDMRGYAMMMICRTWFKFDEEKSNNPFAFYTQCIKHSFIQFLNQEKRQRDIRDELLVDNGMNPSYSYQLEHSNDTFNDDYAGSDYNDQPTGNVDSTDPMEDDSNLA